MRTALRLRVVTIKLGIKERATDQLADWISKVIVVRNNSKREGTVIIIVAKTKREETALQYVQVVYCHYIIRR